MSGGFNPRFQRMGGMFGGNTGSMMGRYMQGSMGGMQGNMGGMQGNMGGMQGNMGGMGIGRGMGGNMGRGNIAGGMGISSMRGNMQGNMNRGGMQGNMQGNRGGMQGGRGGNDGMGRGGMSQGRGGMQQGNKSSPVEKQTPEVKKESESSDKTDGKKDEKKVEPAKDSKDASKPDSTPVKTDKDKNKDTAKPSTPASQATDGKTPTPVATSTPTSTSNATPAAPGGNKASPKPLLDMKLTSPAGLKDSTSTASSNNVPPWKRQHDGSSTLDKSDASSNDKQGGNNSSSNRGGHGAGGRGGFYGRPSRDPELDVDEQTNTDQTAVTMDIYNSDLHLKISSDGLFAEAVTNPNGFCFCWGGARATYGVTKGKVCFEVLLTEFLPVDFGDDHQEEHPHVVRVGWSLDSTSFQLGEEPLSYGYGGTGKFSTNCKFTSYGEEYGQGDVILCMVDLEARPPNISYAKNGRWLGVALPLHRWPTDVKEKALFPHILSKNCKVEVNFGQRAPWFPPPPSFSYINKVPLNLRVRGLLPPAKKADCEMIMMCGLPGTGKTTWALAHAKEHPEKRYNIIGTDSLIDKMKVMGLPRKRNFSGRWDVLIKKSGQCLNKLFEIAGRQKRNLILDQTNVYPNARKRKMRSFEGFQRKVAVLVPNDNESRRRADKRTREEGKEVPESAVLEMKANFKLPEDSDHFIDEIIWIENNREACQPIVEVYNREGAQKTRSTNIHAQPFNRSDRGRPGDSRDRPGDSRDRRDTDRSSGRDHGDSQDRSKSRDRDGKDMSTDDMSDPMGRSRGRGGFDRGRGGDRGRGADRGRGGRGGFNRSGDSYMDGTSAADSGYESGRGNVSGRGGTTGAGRGGDYDNAPPWKQGGDMDMDQPLWPGRGRGAAGRGAGRGGGRGGRDAPPWRGEEEPQSQSQPQTQPQTQTQTQTQTPSDSQQSILGQPPEKKMKAEPDAVKQEFGADDNAAPGGAGRGGAAGRGTPYGRGGSSGGSSLLGPGGRPGPPSLMGPGWQSGVKDEPMDSTSTYDREHGYGGQDGNGGGTAGRRGTEGAAPNNYRHGDRGGDDMGGQGQQQQQQYRGDQARGTDSKNQWGAWHGREGEKGSGRPDQFYGGRRDQSEGNADMEGHGQFGGRGDIDRRYGAPQEDRFRGSGNEQYNRGRDRDDSRFGQNRSDSFRGRGGPGDRGYGEGERDRFGGPPGDGRPGGDGRFGDQRDSYGQGNESQYGQEDPMYRGRPGGPPGPYGQDRGGAGRGGAGMGRGNDQYGRPPPGGPRDMDRPGMMDRGGRDQYGRPPVAGDDRGKPPGMGGPDREFGGGSESRWGGGTGGSMHGDQNWGHDRSSNQWGGKMSEDDQMKRGQWPGTGGGGGGGSGPRTSRWGAEPEKTEPDANDPPSTTWMGEDDEPLKKEPTDSNSKGFGDQGYGRDGPGKDSYGVGKDRYGMGGPGKDSYGMGGQGKDAYGMGKDSYGMGGQGKDAYGMGKDSYGMGGQGKDAYGMGKDNYGMAGSGKDSYGMGQGKDSYGMGQGKDSYGMGGQGKDSYGMGGQGKDSYGMGGQGKDSYGMGGQGKDSYGMGGQGKDSYGMGGQGKDGYGMGGQGKDGYGMGGQGKDGYGMGGQGKDSYGMGGQGKDSYGQGKYGYGQGRDSYRQDNKDGYNQGKDSYGQDSYGSRKDTNTRDGYGRSQYGDKDGYDQGLSGGQDMSSRDSTGREGPSRWDNKSNWGSQADHSAYGTDTVGSAAGKPGTATSQQSSWSSSGYGHDPHGKGTQSWAAKPPPPPPPPTTDKTEAPKPVETTSHDWSQYGYYGYENTAAKDTSNSTATAKTTAEQQSEWADYWRQQDPSYAAQQTATTDTWSANKTLASAKKTESKAEVPPPQQTWAWGPQGWQLTSSATTTTQSVSQSSGGLYQPPPPPPPEDDSQKKKKSRWGMGAEEMEETKASTAGYAQSTTKSDPYADQGYGHSQGHGQYDESAYAGYKDVYGVDSKAYGQRTPKATTTPTVPTSVPPVADPYGSVDPYMAYTSTAALAVQQMVSQHSTTKVPPAVGAGLMGAYPTGGDPTGGDTAVAAANQAALDQAKLAGASLQQIPSAAGLSAIPQMVGAPVLASGLAMPPTAMAAPAFMGLQAGLYQPAAYGRGAAAMGAYRGSLGYQPR